MSDLNPIFREILDNFTGAKIMNALSKQETIQETRHTPPPYSLEIQRHIDDGTPTWIGIVNPEGKYIASQLHPTAQQITNFEFILRACNSHYELLEAAIEARAALKPSEAFSSQKNRQIFKAQERLDAAIAKASGEQS